MFIYPLDHFCFKLKGKGATIITDPYDKTVSGRLMPKVKADIVTLSSKETTALDRVVGSPFIIKGPGEYEIKGVFIFGIPLEKSTAYVFKIDGLRICHLGDSIGKLTEKQIEKLGEIDVLMVPANKKAVTLIEQLEPRIVVPMNSTIKFFKEIGEEKIKPLKKLEVTPSSLPEEREVVWLKK